MSFDDFFHSKTAIFVIWIQQGTDGRTDGQEIVHNLENNEINHNLEFSDNFENRIKQHLEDSEISFNNVRPCI